MALVEDTRRAAYRAAYRAIHSGTQNNGSSCYLLADTKMRTANRGNSKQKGLQTTNRTDARRTYCWRLQIRSYLQMVITVVHFRFECFNFSATSPAEVLRHCRVFDHSAIRLAIRLAVHSAVHSAVNGQCVEKGIQFFRKFNGKWTVQLSVINWRLFATLLIIHQT